MFDSIFQTLVDAFASPSFLSGSLFLGAALGACCCGHCGGGKNDDAGEGDDEDVAPDFSFNYSSEEMREYEETIAQEEARINELVETLDDGSATERQESLEELVQLYFARAAREQEEEEFESARDDYAAGFERIDQYLEEYRESPAILQLIANGRLGFAIALNDEGELEDADEQYALSAEADEKLIGFGVAGAELDLAGVILNRASIRVDLGDRTSGLETLDDAIERFQKLVDADPNNSDAAYYLAKALMTKSGFLRDELDEEDRSSAEALEASEATKKAIELYTSLVDSGSSQYRAELADALLVGVSISAQHEKKDVEDALAAVGRACREYENLIPIEPEVCVELFEAELQRGALLVKLERDVEARQWCDRFLDTFDQFAESDELPLLEGLGIAYQRRATLGKGRVKPEKTIEDLTKAIEMQSRIADSLIESLKEGADHEGCGCGHDHGHEGCGCGHEHGHEGCGCGHEHGHEGCGCGREHGHEGCGCGHCGGGCSETERKFLIETWVGDNYRALTECFYERALAYLELRDAPKASANCYAADELRKAYLEVLRKDEKIESEFDAKLRELKAAF